MGPVNFTEPDGLAEDVLTRTTLLAQRRSVAPGDTVTVPVYLERARQLGSMNFTLTYDPTVVRVNQVHVGDLVRGALFRANTTAPGVIRFGVVVQSGQEITGIGPVAHMNFTALGPEGSGSDLTLGDIFATDVGGAHLELGLEFGRVRIEQKPQGDYDGDRSLTPRDALAALQISVGDRAEDLNLDGRVTAEDARLILREAVTTPCETAKLTGQTERSFPGVWSTTNGAMTR